MQLAFPQTADAKRVALFGISGNSGIGPRYSFVIRSGGKGNEVGVDAKAGAVFEQRRRPAPV